MKKICLAVCGRIALAQFFSSGRTDTWVVLFAKRTDVSVCFSRNEAVLRVPRVCAMQFKQLSRSAS